MGSAFPLRAPASPQALPVPITMGSAMRHHIHTSAREPSGFLDQAPGRPRSYRPPGQRSKSRSHTSASGKTGQTPATQPGSSSADTDGTVWKHACPPGLYAWRAGRGHSHCSQGSYLTRQGALITETPSMTLRTGTEAAGTHEDPAVSLHSSHLAALAS